MRLTRRNFLGAAVAAAFTTAFPMTSAFAAKPLTIGFSQVGAESEWRTANTASIKDAAKKAGVNNYIVKPFNAATLKTKIEAVCGA